MKETKYPTVDEARYLHDELLARFGGGSGILDLGLLESALARPRSGYYKSLSEQAAALMHSLAKSHCFVEANERVALALTAVFLLMNGYKLNSSANDSEKFVLRVARGKTKDLAEITRWIESRIDKATRG